MMKSSFAIPSASSNHHISVMVNGSSVLLRQEQKEEVKPLPAVGGTDSSAHQTVSQGTTSIRVSAVTHIQPRDSRKQDKLQTSFFISVPQRDILMVSGTEQDVRPSDDNNNKKNNKRDGRKDCYYARPVFASEVIESDSSDDKVCYEEEEEGDGKLSFRCLGTGDTSPEALKLQVSLGSDAGRTVCFVNADGQQMTPSDTSGVATPSVSSSGCESAGEGSLADEDEGDLSDTGTILSRRGTIRGMKNHVRASIAALLENVGSKRQYSREEGGRLVLYTTSMGVVRRTHEQCRRIRNILHTLIVRFEERDVFMNRNYQIEVCDRMSSDRVIVPQLFVDGRHLGGADIIERLNETGELRRLLEPFKRESVGAVCQLCGDFRFLPCTTCGGSKKSVQHRHQFNEDFVALRCMVCDENGLVKCHVCVEEQA